MIYEIVNAINDFQAGGFEVSLRICCPHCKGENIIRQFAKSTEIIYFNEVDRICPCCGRSFLTDLKNMLAGDWFLEWANSDARQKELGRIRSLLPDGQYIDTECLECFKDEMRKGDRTGGSQNKAKKKKIKINAADAKYFDIC